MRGFRWLGMLAGWMILAAGCGGGAEGDGAKRPVIAVIPKGTMHAFWKTVEAGARRAAEDFDVELIWRGPLREDDREEQIKVVEDMITRGVDAIVLAPTDEGALRGPVREAARLGIPVVIIDSDLQSDDYVSFIATDNYYGGQLAGRELGRLLGGRGRVAMLRYQAGSGSTMQREAGFLNAVAEFPDIEVVSSNQHAGPTAESAYQASENMLARFHTTDGLALDGIFASNESSAFGMLRALQGAGMAGKVRFVGFDASPQQIEALRGGEMDALIVQRPLRMAYQGVEAAVKHLRGEEVPRRIDTGVTVATAANMDDPDVREVLFPEGVE
jgi:ribose transport system substrate-binding protein